MTIIEGIGDEVTHFFALLGVIIIAYFAWWTTNISEQRDIRTVLLLARRRTHIRLTSQVENVNIVEDPTEMNSSESDSVSSETTPEVTATTGTEVVKPEEAEPGTSDGRNCEEEEERGYILETMDAPSCISDPECSCGNYGYVDVLGEENGTRSINNDESTQVRICPKCKENESDATEAVIKATTEKEGSTETIKIKLKYINDDLKLVDGMLQEQLGDFKRRHFQGELSSNKMIRLIFNGQVLQPDTVTLRSCGLFDNCVVHCLVHQRRPEDVRRPESGGYYATFTRQSAQPIGQQPQPRDWDLGNLMFVFISLLLASAWYLRFVYAHYYSLSATVGLTFLTGVFTVAFTAMYFPVDIRHRMSTGQ